MKVKVSKAFAKFIRDNVNNVDACVVQFSDMPYSWYVGDVYDAGVDYDPATGKYKVICVTYPDEYYAPARYLSTHAIIAEFQRCGVRDMDGLVDMLNNWLQI